MAKRIKEVFSSSEMFHIWSSQKAKIGRVSGKMKSIFFESDTIFSYGYHFAMARLLPKNKVLVTRRKYSVTTSGHIRDMRSAVSHMDKIVCFYPEADKLYKNIESWTNEINHAIKQIEGEKRIVFKVREIDSLIQEVNQAKIFCKEMKIKITKDQHWSMDEFRKSLRSAKKHKLTTEIKAIADEYESRREERRIKASNTRKENRLKQDERKWAIYKLDPVEYVRLWASRAEFMGKPIDSDCHSRPHGITTMLRLSQDGSQVETSMGARVSVKAAITLLKCMIDGVDIRGRDIDGYKVISLNGVLTIGCHKIERHEINRFALSQNWITEDQKLPEDH